MKYRLLRAVDRLRMSYWFLPAFMATIAGGLAFGLVWLDRLLVDTPIEIWWSYTGGPEGARAVLSTIAGSMITVAGLVFSITMVTLTLASSQFGHRLLRNFMKDRGQKVVLGTFVATFLYSLLVLRTIRGTDDVEFVPHMAVMVSVLLAIASIGVLIYFIHHVAVTIQADQVVEAVSNDLIRSIDAMFPESIDAPAGPADPLADDLLSDDDFPESGTIRSGQTGYLQAIDYGRLTNIAAKHDRVFKTHYRPGQFVVENARLVSVLPGGRPVDELVESVNEAFLLGIQRSPTQDPEFAVRQLVEIALRALSPGINDPFTAINCIDWLGAGICRLEQRNIHPARHFDPDGHLRVIGVPFSFEGMVDCAFHQIRQAGQGNASILIRLLEMMETALEQCRRDDDRRILLHHAKMVHTAGQESLPEASDRQVVQNRFEAILRTSGLEAAQLENLISG